jgi:serine/threonine protein kinase/tetratricopeptide (TPR) repeat protein
VAGLTPERWRRLESAFLRLSELPEPARADALAGEFDDDPEIRDLLARMLRTAAASPHRIADAIGQVASSLPLPDRWEGRRFGPYEVVREIGRGGMGVVFEAVRADDEYRKRVALKIATDRRGDPDARSRFLAERQILAELEHESIARFFDGGTEHGIPYFVMELVEGEPIDAYCDRHRLDLAARLTLFLDVCAAVSFAHERLVVHRDLKPGNILITASGRPKLVDFGIAKLLDPAMAQGATQTGLPAWTPDYVSPEQVRGRAVTARTDVYALGLVLYALVCGERGQQADTSSLVALDRSVCERTPDRPSTVLERLGDRARARRVAGDLDTVVMTAIRKEPAERYASVAALGDDLRRVLDNRPILARPSGRLHHARKFVSRHRVGVAAGVAIAATAAAGFIATVNQARRTERRFQQVRSLANAFVFDVHDRIATLPGSTEARHAVVKTALTYLESLREDAADDAALARELAAAYEKIGSVQGLPVDANLGDTAGALQSYGRAVALLQPLADRGGHDARLQLASVLHRTAVVQRARGDREASVGSFARAHDAARSVLDAAPDDRRALELLNEIDSDRSRAAFELRDLATAEAAAGEAMRAAASLASQGPDNLSYQDHLASAHNALGAVQIGLGKLPEAAGHFRESVVIRERLLLTSPDDTSYRRNLAVSYGTLGDVLGVRAGQNLGDTAGAAEVLGKAAALIEQSRQKDPRDRRALYDLANIRVRLGTVYAEAEPPRLLEALGQFTTAEVCTRDLLAQDPGVATYRFLRVVTQRHLGEAFDDLQRPADARRAFERVREIGAGLREGPNGPAARANITQATARLARLRARVGDRAGAIREADLASAELGRGPLGAALVDADTEAVLGQAYQLAGRSADARAHLEASVRLWRGASVAAPLEPRRTAALDALNRQLSALPAASEKNPPGIR